MRMTQRVGGIVIPHCTPEGAYKRLADYEDMEEKLKEDIMRAREKDPQKLMDGSKLADTFFKWIEKRFIEKQ